MRNTLVRPPEQTHRIAFGFQQTLQILAQARIGFTDLLASSSRLALALSWRISFFCLDLSNTPPNRVGGSTCLLDHHADTPSLFGLQSQILPPLLLIEQCAHLLIFFSSIYLHHAQSIRSPLEIIKLFP